MAVGSAALGAEAWMEETFCEFAEGDNDGLEWESVGLDSGARWMGPGCPMKSRWPKPASENLRWVVDWAFLK